MPKKIKEKESDIQFAICQYLEWKHLDFWRQNTTPIWDKSGKGFFRAMPKYAKKGVPDIFVMTPRRMIFLEVKRPKGVLSEDQVAFQEMCKRNGFEYYLVRSVEDVQEKIF